MGMSVVGFSRVSSWSWVISSLLATHCVDMLWASRVSLSLCSLSMVASCFMVLFACFGGFVVRFVELGFVCVLLVVV